MDEEPGEHRDSDETTRTPPLAGGGGAGVGGDGESPERRVGPYRLKRVIGAGGMGVVYEASHDRLGRPVAVKFIGHAAHDPEMRRRFEQERDTLAALRHPAIAHIYDAGQADHNGETVPYIAMEYIVGARPISSACREAGLEIGALIELFESLFDALDHAHRRGILHRDLKPGNILMDSEGKPRIIDFGLSLPTGARGGFESIDAERGGPVGTYKYMSPEQRSGDPLALDHRTDIYSLALVMLEIVEDLAPDAPACVREVLDRALRPEPAQRTPSAAIVRDQLRACRNELVASETMSVVIGAAPKGTGAMLSARWLSSALVSIPIALFFAPYFCCAVLSLCERYAAWATSQAVSASRGDAWRNVRVVEYDAATLEHPAVVGDGQAFGQFGLRARHGEFIDALVDAGASVIAFDLYFRRSTPADEGFALGIRRAVDAGVPVILMDRRWRNASDPWSVNELLTEACSDVAPGTGVFVSDSPWRVDVAGRVDDGIVFPALSLASAIRHTLPGGLLNIDTDDNAVRAQAFEIAAGGVQTQIGPTLTFPITGWARPEAAGTEVGFSRGDAIAGITVGLPSDDELAGYTLRYEDILRGEASALAEVQNRVVVIGRTDEAGNDIKPYGSDRRVAGVYAHAVAIERLIAGGTIAAVNTPLYAFVRVAASFLGVSVVVFCGRRPVTTSALVLGVAIGAGLACVGGVYARWLVFPSPVVFSVLAGAAVAGLGSLLIRGRPSG